MPIKIKIFLTLYVILVAIAVILFENFFGDKSLIIIIIALAPLMILGIWIFPEVVTKKTTAGEDDTSKNSSKS
jgi:ABC-type bacteriocin/lantibiotic exporter with double-glycine peptidase domain